MKFTQKLGAKAALGIHLIGVLALLLLLNSFAVRWNRAVDLTQQKMHELAPKTRKILAAFNGPMKVEIFASGTMWKRLQSFTERLKRAKENVSVEWKDIDLNPARASKLGVDRDATAVIFYEEKRFNVSVLSELAFANGLLNRLNKKKSQVFFLQAKVAGKNTPERFRFLKTKIAEQGVELTNLDSSEIPDPDSNSAIVLLDPKSDLLPFERQKLQNYLASGGHLIVSLGAQLPNKRFPQLLSLLKRYGINQKSLFIIDRLTPVAGGEATNAMVSNLNTDWSALQGMQGRALFPLSAPIEKDDANLEKGAHYTWLARTQPFPATWAESNIKQLTESGRADYEEGQGDEAGPHTVAAMVKLPNKASIAFFSSSGIFQDRYAASGSTALFMGAVSDALGHKGLSSLAQAELSKKRVFISQLQRDLLFYSGLVVLPIFLVGLGLLNGRRHLSYERI